MADDPGLTLLGASSPGASPALLALRRAYQATRNALEAELHGSGLTATQLEVLKLLLRPGPESAVNSEGLDQRAIQSALSVELPPLNAVVCNAGVQAGAQKTFTADGFETTFGVNHLGHFLLVNLLLPRLSPPARVAVVSSGVHDPAQKTGMPDASWNDPLRLAKGELGVAGAKDNATKAGRRRYATSKLANVLFSYDLVRRLPDGVTVNAFDPGLMPGTGLIREAVGPLRWLWHHVLPRMIPLLRRMVSANIHTPAESGAALARLVLDPALAGVSGKYFEGLREIRSSPESYDAVRAERLWQASAALTGLA